MKTFLALVTLACVAVLAADAHFWFRRPGTGCGNRRPGYGFGRPWHGGGGCGNRKPMCALRPPLVNADDVRCDRWPHFALQAKCAIKCAKCYSKDELAQDRTSCLVWKKCVCLKGEEATESPTDPPTESPTESPTDPPTESPTESPTDPPTESPTESPTDPPTESPTETPETTEPEDENVTSQSA